jgi:predicted nucleic-acid-binding Zn-ribbon protein
MTCNHEWEEDEMFACGAVTLMVGTLTDMGEETHVICKKCGESDYVPKDVFTRINLLEEI